MQTVNTLQEPITYAVSLLSNYDMTLTLLLALVLDAFLGEAKKYHYLVGFGWLANHLELRLNKERNAATLVLSSEHKLPTATTGFANAFTHKMMGLLAWLLLVVPIPVVYFIYLNDLIWYWQVLLDGTVLYLALGLTSLHEHAMQVYRPLKKNDLERARHFTGYLVSRETQTLSPDDMSRATIESMLENGHDSVIASLIYYLIGGAPLVILHRFANTLDAMWGYKNARYNIFGYASARLDDVLGFVSAKCCTVLYAVQQPFLLSIKNAYQQGNQYKSYNGGWVMAAGATVMNRTLGGSANYHGKAVMSVSLGMGKQVSVDDIPSSVNIVRRAAVYLLLCTFVVQTLFYCNDFSWF